MGTEGSICHARVLAATVIVVVGLSLGESPLTAQTDGSTGWTRSERIDPITDGRDVFLSTESADGSATLTVWCAPTTGFQPGAKVRVVWIALGTGEPIERVITRLDSDPPETAWWTRPLLVGDVSAAERWVLDHELRAIGNPGEMITALADSDRFALRVTLAGPVLYDRTVTFETTGLLEAMGDDAVRCMAQAF